MTQKTTPEQRLLLPEEREVWDILSGKREKIDPSLSGYYTDRVTCISTPSIRAAVNARLAESKKYWQEQVKYR